MYSIYIYIYICKLEILLKNGISCSTREINFIFPNIHVYYSVYFININTYNLNCELIFYFGLLKRYLIHMQKYRIFTCVEIRFFSVAKNSVSHWCLWNKYEILNIYMYVNIQIVIFLNKVGNIKSYDRINTNGWWFWVVPRWRTAVCNGCWVRAGWIVAIPW